MFPNPDRFWKKFASSNPDKWGPKSGFTYCECPDMMKSRYMRPYYPCPDMKVSCQSNFLFFIFWGGGVICLFIFGFFNIFVSAYTYLSYSIHENTVPWENFNIFRSHCLLFQNRWKHRSVVESSNINAVTLTVSYIAVQLFEFSQFHHILDEKIS